MAASPDFKVYNAENDYRAAFKDASEAAILVAVLGDGSTIRYGHTRKGIVWEEGKEDQPAGESYDHVAEVVYARVEERNRPIREHLEKTGRQMMEELGVHNYGGAKGGK